MTLEFWNLLHHGAWCNFANRFLGIRYVGSRLDWVIKGALSRYSVFFFFFCRLFAVENGGEETGGRGAGQWEAGLCSSTDQSSAVLVRRSFKTRDLSGAFVYSATQYNVHYDNRQAGPLLSTLRLERCTAAIIFSHNKMTQKNDWIALQCTFNLEPAGTKFPLPSRKQVKKSFFCCCFFCFWKR